MSLVARLQLLEQAETCAALRRAAEERYWDGLELATGREGRRLGAIYLLGYVAEILLKVAFFRVCGWHAHHAIKLTMIQTHASWRNRNLHGSDGLAGVLIAQRRMIGRPYDPVFAGQLTRSRPIGGRLCAIVPSRLWTRSWRKFFKVRTGCSETRVYYGGRPVPVIRKETLIAESPQHLKFVAALASELERNQPTGPADAPRIVEEIERGNLLHVTVIWDAWKDIEPEERGRIIMDAYEQQRPEDVARITVALGLTHDEVARLGIQA